MYFHIMSQPKWYVVKTRPKKETSAKAVLEQASYEVFLPQIKALPVRASEHSTPTSLKPLFPSYIFVRSDLADEHHHRMVRYARGVRHILGDIDGPQSIAEDIIETLRVRTRDGSLIEQELLFKEGDTIAVKKGILKDLVGMIEKNMPESGRIKILFKWMNQTLRAVVKYTDVQKAA